MPPRTHKKIEHIWQRIGRLVAASGGVGQHYQIEVDADESATKAALRGFPIQNAP